MGKPLRCVLAGLCLLGALFFLLPLAGGILHFGMLWPAAVLLAGAAALRWPEALRRLLRPRWLRRALSLMAAVCAAAILVTLGKMAAAAGNRPAADAPCTVVVLGCQVLEDGRPSLMLQGRVQAAYDYLAAHPGARVDYIHGEDVVRQLSAQGDTIGFLLPPMGKEELFPTVIHDGVLPRKTFSMGEAQDKRFYLEARRIRN